MTFTSFEFLLFFPLVVLLYNIVPGKGKILYLLSVSYVFYALMQPVYLVLLALVTLFTYGVTMWMGKIEEDKKRRHVQIIGIVLVLLPLFFFKYFNFLNTSIESLLGVCGISVKMPSIKWLLPVGISFYTFMAIGYIVDVYNEEIEVEHNIGAVGLFLSFFPIILSGPIERAGNIFPQLRNLRQSKPSDLTSGAKMMLWGYFMKLCVADRIGIYVSAVFENVAQHNGTSLLFASLLYPIQVYSDLGGYSLIAIGAARCISINIIPNFKRPFFSTSMSELWRRWHMSLIQWLTDYVYTPISFALRKQGVGGIVISLMLTFVISGIWHEAALTFIVWGIVQGVYLSIEALIVKKRSKFEKKYSLEKNPLYIVVCCLLVYILFALSQIFGRCTSIGEAWVVIEKIFTDRGNLFVDQTTLGYGLLMIFILAFKDLRDEFFPKKFKLFESKHIAVRFVSYIFILFLIINMGVLDAGQFIYFKF